MAKGQRSNREAKKPKKTAQARSTEKAKGATVTTASQISGLPTGTSYKERFK